MSITINMFGRRLSRYSLALINGVTNGVTMLSCSHLINSLTMCHYSQLQLPSLKPQFSIAFTQTTYRSST